MKNQTMLILLQLGLGQLLCCSAELLRLLFRSAPVWLIQRDRVLARRQVQQAQLVRTA